LTISGIHNQSFKKRLDISEIYTRILVKYLEKINHFKVLRRATREEEDQGVDWWVTYPDAENVAIQFKLRDKRKDVPVCRYQPLHGIDNVKTVVGRDYRGLQGGVSKRYYVACRDESERFCLIYNLSSEKLKGIVDQLNNEWRAVATSPTATPTAMFGGTYPEGFFTETNVQSWVDSGVWNKLVFAGSDKGSQIWWKKNRYESPKLNMYLPMKHRDEEFWISENVARQIAAVFRQLSGSSAAGKLE
jgi:hypothetical protein